MRYDGQRLHSQPFFLPDGKSTSGGSNPPGNSEIIASAPRITEGLFTRISSPGDYSLAQILRMRRRQSPALATIVQASEGNLPQPIPDAIKDQDVTRIGEMVGIIDRAFGNLPVSQRYALWVDAVASDIERKHGDIRNLENELRLTAITDAEPEAIARMRKSVVPYQGLVESAIEMEHEAKGNGVDIRPNFRRVYAYHQLKNNPNLTYDEIAAQIPRELRPIIKGRAHAPLGEIVRTIGYGLQRSGALNIPNLDRLHAEKRQREAMLEAVVTPTTTAAEAAEQVGLPENVVEKTLADMRRRGVLPRPDRPQQNRKLRDALIRAKEALDAEGVLWSSVTNDQLRETVLRLGWDEDPSLLTRKKIINVMLYSGLPLRRSSRKPTEKKSHGETD